MGLFDSAEARLVDLEARVTALEGGTVEPPADPPEPISFDLGAAISSGGVVDLPAGIITVDNHVYLPSDTVIRGAGPRQTILDVRSSWAFYCKYASGTLVRDLGLQCATPDTGHSAFYVEGCEAVEWMNIWTRNLNWTFKFGNGPTNSDLLVTDIVAETGTQPILIADTRDSHFARLNLDGLGGIMDDHDHSIYFCKNVHNTVWEDLVLSNGGGWGIQFWNGYGEPSTNNLFRNVDITAGTTSSKNGVLIFCDDFDGITIDGLTFRDEKSSTSYSPLRFFGNPRNVVITGIEGKGNNALTGVNCAGRPSGCSFSGTYDGPSLGSWPGVDLSGMTLL